jgi:hypothetical protein
MALGGKARGDKRPLEAVWESALKDETESQSYFDNSVPDFLPMVEHSEPL